MKSLMVSMLLVLVPLQVSTVGFDSGNQLRKSLKGCTKDSGNRACYTAKGYASGVSDANYKSLRKPSQVTKDQLAGVVLKWLDENPQDLHYIASYTDKRAINDAWPCPRQAE